MYIVQVAPECAPVAQAGGLGEVVFGLSRELEIRGNSVEIVLPKYRCMRYDQIYGLGISYQDLWVPWYGGSIHCSVWFGFVHGRKCFFIEPHSPDNFFERNSYYGDKDDALRFAFFSKAALEFLLRSGRRPDIIHCHDWQTALVPVLLFDQYQPGMGERRVCLTIHNFRHQGLCGDEVLHATNLYPLSYYKVSDRLQDDSRPGTINLLKGGIVYSNFTTTVSPRHAWETRLTNQSEGLGHTLHIHREKFQGILNGVDYDLWNPEIDPHIVQNYSVADPAGKYANKRALRGRFMLRDTYRPIVAYVGRLDEQKGVHLIQHAISYSLEAGAQFVLLGSSPDRKIQGRFVRMKKDLNDNEDCHLELEFSSELAHMIYAGADILIMPSMFEPCGLAQLIAMKYGTVPAVRSIGGLADTVFDRDHSDRPPELRNGYVFHQTDHIAVESVLSRAIGLWYGYPDEFRDLMVQGMKADYSWATPGQRYLDIYEKIRHK